MNVLIFALQTVPDINGARRLYDLHGLSDEDVLRAVLHKRRQSLNSESFPLPLQKIAAISVAMASQDRFKVWSLGDKDASEEDLLQRFYDGIERYCPRIISWGGSSYELPVIHYRSLQYPVIAARYWENGDNDSQFKEDNYLSRYHQRHTDLQDVLAAYKKDTAVSLDELASLCGFPGVRNPLPIDEQLITQEVDFATLCRCCENKVLQLYLLFLNWERNRGNLNSAEYDDSCSLVKKVLTTSESPHLIEFEKNWINL